MIQSLQQLRVTDLDALGHVSASRLIDLLINAHYELLTPTGWVICRQEISYQRPITAGTASVAVHTAATKIGRTSLTLRSHITEAGDPARLYLEAATIWVHTDPATRLPAPIPEPIRHALDEESTR